MTHPTNISPAVQAAAASTRTEEEVRASREAMKIELRYRPTYTGTQPESRPSASALTQAGTK